MQLFDRDIGGGGGAIETIRSKKGRDKLIPPFLRETNVSVCVRRTDGLKLCPPFYSNEIWESELGGRSNVRPFKKRVIKGVVSIELRAIFERRKTSLLP